MDNLVRVYIEIQKDSRIKYEFDKVEQKLVIDRILEEPFRYPYSYGFIPNTLADDNDELDILIITNKELRNDNYYNVHIIGGLEMEDEKGMDEKILCVLEEDYEEINNLDDLDDEIKNKIHSFFSNYKNNSPGKWSKVSGFIDKDTSIKLYNKYIVNQSIVNQSIVNQ